jgi:predicted metal-dependent hydrolase
MGWRDFVTDLLAGRAARSPVTPEFEMEGHSITLASRTIEYRLTRSARRTIGLQIDPRGLNVRVPQRAALRDIEQALQGKSDWILRKLAELEKLSTQEAPSAEQPAAKSPAEIRVLKRQARSLFAERLAHFERQHACVPVRWSLTSARTRWGSCSPGGHVRLNWRLIHCPIPVIDYVIAHELAHLEELNHGPRFWARVEVLYPDWRRERKILRGYRLDGWLDDR